MDVPKIRSTNDLLEALSTLLTTQGAAASTASDMGISMSPATPFFRMGEPHVIPVGPNTAVNPYPASGTITLPKGATTFRIVNPNPFCVRLRGTRAGQVFNPVTATTGWLLLPESEGIYGTLSPVQMSAMSVSIGGLPGRPAGTGVIEVQYGTGHL